MKDTRSCWPVYTSSHREFDRRTARSSCKVGYPRAVVPFTEQHPGGDASMQSNPNDVECQGGGGWRHRPGTVLLLVLGIEILATLMGFVDRVAELTQILIIIAAVLLVGVIVNLVMARRQSKFDQSQCRQRFSSSQRLLLGVLLLLMMLFCLPVWRQHGDFSGFMHGHPIWTGGHVH